MAPNVAFPRPLYPPSHEKGPVSDGIDVVAVKRAISRAGFFPWNDFDDSYNEKFADNGVAAFQRAFGIQGSGNYGQATHDQLEKTRRKGHPDEWAFDQVSINLMAEAAQGPEATADSASGTVCKGGRAVLDHDCTHATSGIELYPAFDDVFRAGAAIIAPEPITVTRQSSSRPGAAFYADGVSGVKYWFGHLVSSPPVGRKFAKGATVGTVVQNTIGGGPHVHVGVNVEKLWGNGKQLAHHTNYTHGAPRIGAQLAAKAV